MKQFLTLLMIILFTNTPQAQDNDYTSLWKKVNQFEIEGLPQSALKVVNTITKQAKKDRKIGGQLYQKIVLSAYSKRCSYRY